MPFRSSIWREFAIASPPGKLHRWLISTLTSTLLNTMSASALALPEPQASNIPAASAQESAQHDDLGPARSDPAR